MKCPELYKITQFNIRRPVIDENNIIKGENHLLLEHQNFGECYKENCAAWDKEKQICRKVRE